MTVHLTLYTRKNCCLCDEMKAVIAQVGAMVAFEMAEIDIDGSAELARQFGDQVPVLFIDGRKAFKYRLTVSQLKNKLAQKRWRFLRRSARAGGEERS